MIGISGASNPAEGGKLTSMEIIASLMETTGDRPSPRGLHQAVLYGSQLVVWGGLLSYDQPNKVARDNSVYILNTRSARWSKLDIQPAPSARFWHAVCLHESKLVVFGGAESEQQVLGDQWSLDLSTLGWGSPKWQQIQVAQGSPSPTKRGGHAMFAYQDKLYVFGGYTGKTVLNDTWCFDMTTRTWAELKCSGDVPSPRAFLAAALIGDAMYVSGGVSKAGKALGDAYIFKTNEQIWYRFPDLDLQPSARWGHSLAVYGGRVLVIGGTRNHKEPNEMTEIHSLDTSLIQYPKGAGEIIIKSGQTSHSPVIEESSVEAVESKPVDTEETEHTGMIPLREEESDSHSGEDKSTITKGDAITAEMSVIEIDRLVAHGCRDITHQLDLSQVSDYPVVSGEFSDLYRATLRTGQVVALKCRRLSAGGLEENRASIAHAAHEIYVISKCRASRRESARIIELTGVALFRDQLVMVSPWMERGNLMQFISQNPKRDPHYWCYYVVSGVANLHGLGIIHGNLKPANILVGDHSLKIAGFGNATLSKYELKFAYSNDEPRFSLRWTAPEILDGEAKSKASDVYALGTVIYEIISGALPYAEVNDTEVVLKVMKGEVPSRPESQLPSGVEYFDNFWAILTKCWAYDPAERPTAFDVERSHDELHKNQPGA
ncbi:Tip elongation aberrant protein 1 [Rhizoctonia solani]|uniref:Tip elongation aberrant protein 1 n=1 Tax=Rhizoctonia solani TaxID=456999 RepID=A0A0K6GI75_9AGAM|nr:Tip elongation aberrant protein 1 [Rhizoctonia solani]